MPEKIAFNMDQFNGSGSITVIGSQYCADDFEVIWREFPRRPEHGPAEGDEGGTVLCASHMTRNGAARACVGND